MGYKTIKDQHQINESIRDREIRLIDEDGAQLGIMSSRQALELAEERALDLVKISPNANPPVCKLMDYHKYMFELSKKEKKYKLSSLGKEARFRNYEDSFVWLNEAMIVNACFNATDPHVGLALSSDNTTQKCYMADTGLLVTLTFQDKKFTDNELYKSILFDKLNINEGMLMENIVSQMLRIHRQRLYFYSRSDNLHRENNIEIDFLITEGKKIAPVEVKSSNYTSHSSLDKFRKHFHSVIKNSYILYTKDVMIKDDIIHLPVYMAELL